MVADTGYDGVSNKRMYIGNDGGVWKTDDILATPHATVHPCCTTIDFSALNNGLVITQFTGGAGDPATGAIVGGTQGNGTLMYSKFGRAHVSTPVTVPSRMPSS